MGVAVSLFALVVFFNRYIFGLYLRVRRGAKVDDTRPDYEPTVTIVVPLYNEGRSIYDTIASFAKLEYPPEKLAVIVIDDCSTDDSYKWACQGARDFPNVQVTRNPSNMGKRRGINRAVRLASSEIIISVDSDVIVHRAAVREIVIRFSSPEVAAVGGRVHISNPNETWLTKMQTIKYYFGQEHMKNLERSFESVLCLSGCLTAYRRDVLLELEQVLESRSMLGIPIKYGEDRFLTHQIVTRGYRTRLTMEAMCFTKAPATLPAYFNQQLRWKRSNVIDYLVGLRDAWRLHPLVCVHYLSMLLLLFAYPFVIVRHLLDHELMQLMMFHVIVIALFGWIYHLAPSTRRLPPWLRVHPAWFLPMAVLMPVAYLLLTPLSVFTLDSSCWETRGHQGSPAARQGPAKESKDLGRRLVS